MWSAKLINTSRRAFRPFALEKHVNEPRFFTKSFMWPMRLKMQVIINHVSLTTNESPKADKGRGRDTFHGTKEVQAGFRETVFRTRGSRNKRDVRHECVSWIHEIIQFIRNRAILLIFLLTARVLSWRRMYNSPFFGIQ